MTFKPTFTTVLIFNEEILYKGLVKMYWGVAPEHGGDGS